MVMHDISLGLELLAAMLTVLYIGELLLQRFGPPRVSYLMYKRSLAKQVVCKRCVAA